MRYICSRCKLTSADGNLWCQESDCPAGTLPQLLNYGDYLGNIKIIELLRVLRHSVIYKAQRGENEKERFFIKIANPGNENYLKREAEVIRSITRHHEHSWRRRFFLQERPSALPNWEPHQTVSADTSAKTAYGVADHQSLQRYFYLMDYVEGEFLGDVLLNHPQPWHEHVGWFVMLLAEAIQQIYTASKGHRYLHLNLNSDVILVHRDTAGLMLPLLLDMGFCREDDEELNPQEVVEMRQYMLPSYTPYDFVKGGVYNVQLSQKLDVYELGIILYEMLSGAPAHPYTLRNNEEIYKHIEESTNLRLKRQDLPENPLHGQNQIDWLLGRSSRLSLPLNELVESILRRDLDDSTIRTPKDLSSILRKLYGQVQVTTERDWNWVMRSAGKFVAIAAAVVVLIFAFTVVLNAIFT